MRVRIDESRCTGHGRCYAVAPEEFGYDDDGFGIVRNFRILEKQRGAVLRAAAACPESAIVLDE